MTVGIYLVCATVAVALAGIGVLVGWGIAAGIFVGVVALVLAVRSEERAIGLLGVSAFTAVPGIVPRGIVIAGGTVWFYELLLMLILVRWSASQRHRALSDFGSILLLLMVGCFAVVGLWSGNPPLYVLNDARGLVLFAAALFVFGRLSTGFRWSVALTWLTGSLWCSMALTTISQVSGLQLAGVSSDAALEFADSGSSAASGVTRIVTSANHFSTATIALCFCLIAFGRVKAGRSLIILVPSLAILFFGFSRNALVGIAATIALALLLQTDMKSYVRFIGRGVLVLVAITCTCALLLLVPAQPVRGLALSVSAYAARVVGGLTPSTLAVDTSALYRLQEDDLMWQAIAESPLTGHGFGYQYRVAHGLAGSFEATSGTYYGHNFYLWLAVKTGLVGLAVLAVSLLPIVRSTLTLRDPYGRALVCTLSGLFVLSVAAPLPEGVESGSAMLIGAIAGTIAWRCRVVSLPTGSLPVAVGADERLTNVRTTPTFVRRARL